ncbi:MAG: hypothetical protein HQL87_12905 [Magnetococcales bacterium]|nr:hypothetical protein [Magnetococcales bacterium]
MRSVVVVVAVIVGLISFRVDAGPTPLNQQPMYGGREKNEDLKRSDETFLTGIMLQGYTKESGSKEVVDLGWKYFFKGDVATAMQRFNQAWLLNPENGDVYHGFAVVTAQRGGPMQEAEKYFQMAIAKPGVTPTAFADYARLLNMQGRFDDAIAQGQKALAVDSKAHNACIQISYAYLSQKDIAQACGWARRAKENGDIIDPPNYVEFVCKTSND